ncbi:MAG: YciI family protein, partial [Ilumatobacteraceae bacterium]|nr:YciI family protein [Ilumatobacteraceae bacterium]
MQYMLILGAAPEAWADDTPADDGVFDDWFVYTRALAEAGVLVSGHGLQGNDVATTVRVRGGERLVTDGPFVDSKEHL